MKKQKKMKERSCQMIVDILMIAALVFLMNGQNFGAFPHELVGAMFFALFVLHQILNRMWWKAIPKGKYNALRMLQTILNISLFVDVLVMIVSGIMISRALFTWLPFEKGQNIGRTLHLIGSYWGFVAMSMHVGMHFPVIKARIAIKARFFNTKWATALYLLVSVCALFSLFSGTDSIVLTLLGYIACMILFAGIGYYLTKSLRKREKLSFSVVAIGAVIALVIAVIAVIGYSMIDRPNISASNRLFQESDDNKVLVVYFSRAAVTADIDNVDATSQASVLPGIPKTGRMESIASMVQKATGADHYEIVTASYYPTDYTITTVRALVEKMHDMRPALLNLPESLDQYDVIFVGYPAWWGTPPMAVATFLESYDLTGKTVVPFAISIDTPASQGYDAVRSWTGGATVLPPYDANGKTQEDIMKWIESLALSENKENAAVTRTDSAESVLAVPEKITVGTQTQRGFINDNTYHSPLGDIHYSSYISESYDGSEPYALFITLPGWEGLYFQGVGANMVEDYGTEAPKYNDKMIVLSAQLDDWGETSADMTIALTEYFLEHYNIDPAKVYLEGLSGGGETGSIVMGKRPELYAAYLMASSQWDGDLNVLAEGGTPVYMAIGEKDSYYGSDSLKNTYTTLRSLYEEQGLSEDEINDLIVLDVKDQKYFSDGGIRDQHAGGALFAHDEKIMGWLFGH